MHCICAVDLTQFLKLTRVKLMSEKLHGKKFHSFLFSWPNFLELPQVRAGLTKMNPWDWLNRLKSTVWRKTVLKLRLHLQAFYVWNPTFELTVGPNVRRVKLHEIASNWHLTTCSNFQHQSVTVRFRNCRCRLLAALERQKFLHELQWLKRSQSMEYSCSMHLQ